MDWEEAGYRTTDNPPRGEILVSGHNIAAGYLKLEKETSKDFIELDGLRYWISGDIGEISNDGLIKLVDRKKSLLKLQNGEYIALGKVSLA